MVLTPQLVTQGLDLIKVLGNDRILSIYKLYIELLIHQNIIFAFPSAVRKSDPL